MYFPGFGLQFSSRTFPTVGIFNHNQPQFIVRQMMSMHASLSFSLTCGYLTRTVLMHQQIIYLVSKDSSPSSTVPALSIKCQPHFGPCLSRGACGMPFTRSDLSSPSASSSLAISFLISLTALPPFCPLRSRSCWRVRRSFSTMSIAR